MWGKNNKNLQLLGIQACSSANKASFQKMFFVRVWKDGWLAELQARLQIFTIFAWYLASMLCNVVISIGLYRFLLMDFANGFHS